MNVEWWKYPGEVINFACILDDVLAGRTLAGDVTAEIQGDAAMTIYELNTVGTVAVAKIAGGTPPALPTDPATTEARIVFTAPTTGGETLQVARQIRVRSY